MVESGIGIHFERKEERVNGGGFKNSTLREEAKTIGTKGD